uniref:Uncharacterized protein n=1 Tax=Setaria viridis TaxID=4556 RepID=A0A4U6VW71_SETVI|nr:hypothetical protein SEVIR_2G255432v2 [Setaria viridis]
MAVRSPRVRAAAVSAGVSCVLALLSLHVRERLSFTAPVVAPDRKELAYSGQCSRGSHYSRVRVVVCYRSVAGLSISCLW